MASNQSVNNNSATATNDGAGDNNASLSYFQKTVCLQDWWLVMAEKDFQGKRLGVAGLTSREKQAVREFSSAPIIRRYDVFTLETTDGICVLLKGFMNEVRTKENGFPSEVLDHFVFGFPDNWEKYAKKCLGEESSKKDVSSTLDCEKLFTDSGRSINNSTLFGVEDCGELTPGRNKADICEATKGQHKLQSGVEGKKRTWDESKREVSEKFIISDYNTNLDDASVESPSAKSSDEDNAHRFEFTNAVSVETLGMNLKSSGKRSDTPKRQDKISPSPGIVRARAYGNLSSVSVSTTSMLGTSETQNESLPTGSVVGNAKILEMNCPNMDSNINATTPNSKTRVNHGLKNSTNHKSKNCSPTIEAHKDLDEENLNMISPVGTTKAVGERDVLEFNLSEGRMHNLRSRRKLKDDQKTVNLLKNEKNRLDSGLTGKSDYLKTAAENGESESGGRSILIPDRLQPTDDETEPIGGIIKCQPGKQSKNMDKAMRSSTGLGDENQIDDSQFAVGKKETNVRNASNSGEKTKRKLTYESPVTHRGTEKTSFVSPESFRRSRSGRILLPRQEFWRNQMPIYRA